MWKTIFKIVAGFGTLVGSATIIWLTSAYFTKKDATETVFHEQLEIVIDNQNNGAVADDSICAKLDQLVRQVNTIADKQIDIAKGQEALSRSYSRYLSNDETLTKEDFLEYMQGLTFDFKKKEIVLNSTVSNESINRQLESKK